MQHAQDTAFRHPLLNCRRQGKGRGRYGWALVAFEMRFAVGINRQLVIVWVALIDLLRGVGQLVALLFTRAVLCSGYQSHPGQSVGGPSF
jgi:hypothetical protein